jgi:hypothetical protein
MRVALGRRNANDPDSSDALFLSYVNDFISLSMPNDTKLFESFGTLSFTIDETSPNATYTYNDVGADAQFMNLSQSAFISLLDPVGHSVSWNRLLIYQDPGQFYRIWGINNEDILIRGYPTGMLYYGTEFVFRTLPNTAYLIKIYGYKKNEDFPTPDVDLPFDYWLRYVSYGAAVNYARDYRFSADVRALIEATFMSERKLLLTHTHNQIKMSRSMPRF